MQRAEALQPLSKQHKTALMTCLLIRKGIRRQASISVMTDFLLKCWEKELSPHFVEEEKHLLPLLRQFSQGKAYAETIQRDHDLIRNCMVHLQQEAVSDRLLPDIANLLEQHIRYEERIVFQAMQDFVPPATLAALHFHENNVVTVCNTYPNHFWE
jgi:iron-sulfur cluster repair protein YtfE (RIC family)